MLVSAIASNMHQRRAHWLKTSAESPAPDEDRKRQTNRTVEIKAGFLYD
jgi:hypothetical protein